MESADSARAVPVPALVAFAVFLLVIALAAGALYAFDGLGTVQELIADIPYLGGSAPGGESATPPGAASTDAALVLPSGMSEEFALRLWQEQVDSQTNITRLVSGEVTAINVRDAAVDGDAATIGIGVTFADGSTAPGVLGLSRFDETWYVQSVTGLRSEDAPAMVPSALPGVDDVDVPVVNTLIAEQSNNSAVTSKLVSGGIETIFIDSVEQGQGTATLGVTFGGPGGQSGGQLVAIRTTSGGEQLWFLARFSETGSDQ
jgi:hypothetical protein